MKPVLAKSGIREFWISCGRNSCILSMEELLCEAQSIKTFVLRSKNFLRFY